MSNSLLEGLANAGQEKPKESSLSTKLPTQVEGGGSKPPGQQPLTARAPEVKPANLRTDVNPSQGTQTGQGEKTKSITMTKLGSGPWTFAFQGDIRNRDINMLRIRLVHAFKKLKLKSRISRMKLQRKEGNNGTGQ